MYRLSTVGLLTIIFVFAMLINVSFSFAQEKAVTPIEAGKSLYDIGADLVSFYTKVQGYCDTPQVTQQDETKPVNVDWEYNKDGECVLKSVKQGNRVLYTKK